MKIHITGTPEIKKKQISEIVDFLNKSKGPLKFSSLENITDESIQSYRTDEHRDVIDFYDINKICEIYRDSNPIPAEDILVVLTNRKMLCEYVTIKNWFSFFSGNNIIVRDNNWKGCDKINPEKIMAHQIIENVFQILAGYKIQSHNDFHHQSESCINDFCGNEYEIQYKIRAAHICEDCQNKAIKNGMNSDVLFQVINIILMIRDDISNHKSIVDKIELKNIYIKSNGDIEIGDKEIILSPIAKTVYVFFLMNKGESFRPYHLKNHKKELESVFLTIKKTDSTKPVHTLFGDDSFRSNTDTLKDHRYNIKKAIKKVLGDQLSEIYKIGSYTKEEGTTYFNYSTIPNNTSFKVEIDPIFLRLIGKT